MRRTLIAITVGTLFGCTPKAVEYHLLTPIPRADVITAAALYAESDPATRGSPPPHGHQTVILGADSVFAAATLYELEDIFLLDAYVLNGGSQDFVINPSQLVLLDGARIMLRQLQPHEAANIYASRVTSIPPYRPKYTYQVQSYTQGQVNVIGNSANYRSNTSGTVTPVEDPYNALGYQLGAAIAKSRNEKLLGMANLVYSSGFVEDSRVPPQVAARGGVYWLKPQGWRGPLTLRFLQTGYEVQFTQPAGR